MLVSKQVVLGNTAVELTDGIDTDQEYEIRFSHVSGSGQLGLGGSDLESSNAFLADPNTVLRLQNEELYGMVPSGLGTSVTVSILAYSV